MILNPANYIYLTSDKYKNKNKKFLNQDKYKLFYKKVVYKKVVPGPKP